MLWVEFFCTLLQNLRGVPRKSVIYLYMVVFYLNLLLFVIFHFFESRTRFMTCGCAFHFQYIQSLFLSDLYFFCLKQVHSLNELKDRFTHSKAWLEVPGKNLLLSPWVLLQSQLQQLIVLFFYIKLFVLWSLFSWNISFENKHEWKLGTKPVRMFLMKWSPSSPTSTLMMPPVAKPSACP